MRINNYIGLILALAQGASCLYAQSAPIVSQTYESIDREFAYKHFVVECEEANNYYVDFWLMPARYANDEYTQFKVFVNGEFIDNITPSEPNWQSAVLDNYDQISLNQGINTISVATVFPELPSVESVSVSLESSEFGSNPQVYNEYLDSALGGVEIGEDVVLSDTDDVGSDFQLQYRVLNKTLRYNFFKSIYCQKGEEICITTSSPEPHYVDIVFEAILGEIEPDTLIAEPIEPGPLFPRPLLFNNNVSNSATNFGYFDSIPTQLPSLKPIQMLKYAASSEEMQGLNWQGASEADGDLYSACKYVPIPKSGYYLIRLRPYRQNQLSVADVNINGTYNYDDVPICYVRGNCTIPSDDFTYCTEVIGANAMVDDPMVFIHGAAAGRVVGYNDDYTIGLSNRLSFNSHIEQNYIYPVTEISFSSYSSQSPVSTCDVYVYKSTEEESANAVMRKDRQRKSEQQASISQIEKGESIIVPGIVPLGDDIVMRSQDVISHVSVYSISGRLVGSSNVKGNFYRVKTNHVGITSPGVYILSVRTTNGCVNKKIAVK